MTFVLTAGTLSFIAISLVAHHPVKSRLKQPQLGQTGGHCLSH